MKQVIAAYATHDTETGKSIAVIGYSRRRRKRFHKKLRHELRHVADRQERGHDSIPLAQKLTYAIGSKASFASLHLSVSNLGFISANKIAGLVSGNDESMANQLYRDIQPHLEQGQASTLVMALAAATMSAGYILDSREIRARKAEKIDTPELISITR